MQKAVDILSKYWGYRSFRSPQDKIVKSLIDKKDTLAILPTGGGKSVCFQVPALLQEGVCIVISPLIALIRDQVDHLSQKGIRAIDLSGKLPFSEIERLLDNVLYGDYKFLYLSPERLENEWVQQRIQAMNVSLIAIDEAHCISHWGKDFRPSYLKCGILKKWFPEATLVALTATATQQVIEDIKQQLHLPKINIIRGSLWRKNLNYNVFQVSNKEYHLCHFLKQYQGSAIVYLRNRRGVERMSDYLEKRGISATYFHGGLSSEEKSSRLGMWLMNDVRVMVATNAFGMGIDKPDVRLVLHWDIPASIEDYFQEVGRAGRDGNEAHGILLYNTTDLQKLEQNYQDSLIDISFLKQLYHQLHQHFWIAYGEGKDQCFSLNLTEFCHKNQWNISKTYAGLQTLERIGILEVSEKFKQICRIQLMISPNQLLNFLHQHSDEKIKSILLYLVRKEPLIYKSQVSLTLEDIALGTTLSILQLTEILTRLSEREIISYKPQNSDLEILFKNHREDDRIINMFRSDIQEHNEIKRQKYEAIRSYIENESQCRSRQLLSYFGENITDSCGNCSYCQQKEKEEVTDKKNVFVRKLYDYIKEHPSYIHEIQTHWGVDREVIIEAIEYLCEEQYIEKNEENRYQSKQK